MIKKLCLIVLFLFLFSSCTFADNEFVIGHWYGPGELTQERFAQIASGNFNVVMIDAKAVEANIKAIDYCQANGLNSIVVDSRIQPMRSDEDTFKSNFDAVIKDYASNPALWGYFVKDEPDASMFINLGDVNRYLQENDKEHTSFINLLPIDASAEQLGKTAYEHYVDEYTRMIHPKILSFENYSLLKDGVSKQYFLNLEIIRRQGIKHKTPFCYSLQSMPHGQYRDPSENDLRFQVNTALAYGSKGIIYFKDFSQADSKCSFQDAVFDSSGKPTRKYQQITNINAELKKLAPVLMHLNSAAIYHTSNIPEGSKALPTDGLICKIDGGEFVVGQFVSDDGAKYAMIVNKSLKNSSNAKVYFSQTVAIDEVDPTSGIMHSNKIIDADGSIVWKTTFSPGQGRIICIKPLLRPVTNLGR